MVEENQEEIKKLMELKKSLKDVSTTWLSGIIESLQRLEAQETLMFEGCESLQGYVDEKISALQKGLDLNKILTEIQIKNMDLMVHEFQNLFINSQGEIEKEDLEGMEKTLGKIIDLKSGGDGKTKIKNHLEGIKTQLLFEEGFSDLQKTKHWIKLTPVFWEVARQLQQLRKPLVKKLEHLLWARDKPTDKKEKR